MNIAFKTLGCKVNQFETQALELILSERGHSIVDDFSIADIIVINTCTVTSTSDQKSRKTIRNLASTYPNSKIAVCGCLAQVNPKSISDIKDVSIITGTADRLAFIDALESINTSKENTFTPDNPLKRREFEFLPAGGLHGHTRAMLKIEDGCSNFCTYCIIPYSRGPVRSLPLEKAISECCKLFDSGYKEVVLTGIEISSYGKDLRPKSSLCEVVYTLCKEFPSIRFRLGSIEPRSITEEFCVKLKSFTNLCPHFHLSMQSGCDETLKRMNRKYDTARFYESVSLLNLHFPNCAITTDMIVGFPGETDDEFEKSLDFLKKCKFSSMHIFPYSQRKGTPADSMPNQIPKSVKTARAKKAGLVALELEKNYLESQIGMIKSVLFEECSDGYWCGHSDNYIKIYLKSDENLKNQIKEVNTVSIFKDGLLGKAL